MLVIGLVVNPVAGIGGRVGLKGSDGECIQEQARALNAKPLAFERCLQCIDSIRDKAALSVKTAAGSMGESVCQKMTLDYEVVYRPPEKTGAGDTIAAVQAFLRTGVDLILFAGGDGTARNVVDALDKETPVLGIPAGCKIHSGVYAITPRAAGEVVNQLLTNELVSYVQSDVVDLDEVAFREGRVKVRHYGELWVPAVHEYIQSTKVGGIESEVLVLDGIADYIMESYEESVLIVGSGKTCQGLMERFGAPENTLLGVDIVYRGEVLARDCNEQQMLSFLANNRKPLKLVVTVIGGQGHVFGRGNQQLSPDVLRAIGKDNMLIVASKTKLQRLEKRPMICDTGDDTLNRMLSGQYSVITGYNDRVLYTMESI